MFHNHLVSKLTVLAALCGFIPSAAAQQALIEKLGKDEYSWHCAACHGADGNGDGEFAAMLIKPPSNLTTLAERYGQDFPFWRVYRIISGKEKTPGHATIQMPKFWERFQKDVGKPGFMPPEIRVLVLTHYIASLQR